MKHWRKWPIGEVEKKSRAWRRLSGVSPVVKILYFRGNWDEQVFGKTIAVVGARKMTDYGKAVVGKLVPDLVRAGYTIVSGFMYGVDSEAHRVCLENGGKTVAVLGGGLNQLVPVSNDKLYGDILNSGGVVLSEREAEYRALLWTFPARNRIVAGLSDAVLVVEGGEKSGSLITAKLGFDMGKKVLAVPGPITSSMSGGTNWLIKNGATAVTGSEDILAEMGEEKQQVVNLATNNLSEPEKRVVEELKRQAATIDDLARRLEMEVAELGQILSKLTLEGVVSEMGNKFMLGLKYAD